MSMPHEQFECLLRSMEDENLEFKTAERNYPIEKLINYCAALANEGGGKVVLGVTDKRPRQVIGTSAFEQPENIRLQLINKLSLNIKVEEFHHPQGRVLIFHIPSRPIGTAIKGEGVYWSRKGDSLVPMSEDRLREIFSESENDFSAQICNGLKFEDLIPEAIEDFRKRWILKSNNQNLSKLSPEQLLADAEAAIDGKLTYAALILFGTHQAMGKYLAQNEVVFEYRSSHASGPAAQREEFRQGFFSYYDKLWDLINLRNDKQHFQSGLFVLDIPTFSERPVREALLNAISHRNYQLAGNIFVRQFPRKLIVENPGGFPVGINMDNILNRQSPRNRRIADVFCKCGLVERSGQGINLMFEKCIQESKPIPDFSETDQYHVTLHLNGEIQDPRFLEFLHKVGAETLDYFDTSDFLLLDHVHKEKAVPQFLQSRLQGMIDKGLIERFGKGRGVKYILCRRYYHMAGTKGTYTRRKGLDRETNKALLLKHITENTKSGSGLRELLQVLPSLSRPQVQNLLSELKAENKIHNIGTTRAALWYTN